ncbi:hypothetical protein C2I36_13835 [Rhodobacteraceae bacterium WD3A24]|nr:hypothetical protein C2I36_13835 [Rhodobacteraceae bacterium WD3A24]
MANAPEKWKRQIGGELVIPVLAIVFTLYYFSTIIDAPWTAQVNAFGIGAVLLILCVAFIIRGLALVARGDGSFGMANLFTREDIQTGRIWLLVATVAYCYFIVDFGFTLTTFLFLLISMLILAKGKQPLLILFVSAVMSLCGWALFIWAFDTRFPRGWFEETMRMVVDYG